MTNFLPQNYEVPKTASDYTKFEEGLNQIRILSSAIIGYEYWTNENKPVRLTAMPEDKPADIKLKDDGSYLIKHFWAFTIYNYQQKRIQILEITQTSIMQALKAIVDNPKWGDPQKFDIAITRTGKDLETKYNVQAEPPIGEPSEEILKALKAKPVNLVALFKGENPFEKKEATGGAVPVPTEPEINVEDIPFA